MKQTQRIFPVLSGFFILFMFYSGCTTTTFRTDNTILKIGSGGRVEELISTLTGKNYLSKDSDSYLMTLYSREKRLFPASVTYHPKEGILHFKFVQPDISAEVRIIQKDDYLTLELLNAEPADLTDAVQWGPVYTTVSGKIGEVVGVVRDNETSVGMLLLNVKTLGGLYNQDGICSERGCLAMPADSGSSLQAYSINRDRNRKVTAMGQLDIPLGPVKGETASGSKIALFTCREPSTLDHIEKIVLSEKLPYPTYKGIWTKKAFLQSPSYMISDFRETEMDEAIKYAVQGGFFSIYHEGPFKTWGHYELNPEYFPNGKEGIRKCAEKAKTAGLLFGVHTLTNFINTDDPYVTPVPDKRLAQTGFGLLTGSIDNRTTEIEVNTNEFFSNENNNNLHTVAIGNELIRYQSVTAEVPFKLTGFERGAFGTQPAPHQKNDTVKKLFDHAYKVFFPNLDMQREIAVNLAKFFNETGIGHLDFDGHEGCQASGEGDYAECLFAEDFYHTLDHEFVNGTSRSKPYYWYINTLCNWGEPWYGGFRESMQEYRISNQAMLERNYLPHMLGWYMLTRNTTLPEMEWMLARAAGWNAGFAMVARMNAVRENPISETLLDAIREWEKARLSMAFSIEQRESLKNGKNEFHLEKINDREWNLYQAEFTDPFILEKDEKHSAKNVSSSFDFSIRSFPQPLQFRIEIKGTRGAIRHIRLKPENYSEIYVPGELKPGETILCDGSDQIRIYDGKGKQKGLPQKINRIPDLTTGSHQITMSGDFTGEEPPQLELIIKTFGNPAKITAQK